MVSGFTFPVNISAMVTTEGCHPVTNGHNQNGHQGFCNQEYGVADLARFNLAPNSPFLLGEIPLAMTIIGAMGAAVVGSETFEDMLFALFFGLEVIIRVIVPGAQKYDHSCHGGKAIGITLGKFPSTIPWLKYNEKI